MQTLRAGRLAGAQEHGDEPGSRRCCGPRLCARGTRPHERRRVPAPAAAPAASGGLAAAAGKGKAAASRSPHAKTALRGRMPA